jgi:hypothetical protein
VKIPLLLGMATVLSLGAVAQTNPQTTMAVEPMNQTLTFRVNVISRSVKAINYKHRGAPLVHQFSRLTRSLLRTLLRKVGYGIHPF